METISLKTSSEGMIQNIQTCIYILPKPSIISKILATPCNVFVSHRFNLKIRASQSDEKHVSYVDLKCIRVRVDILDIQLSRYRSLTLSLKSTSRPPKVSAQS